MYFLNLVKFHPDTGINTDNHNDHPFLKSTDGLFKPNDLEFDYNRRFPFDKIELNAGQSFYLSEPNLLKLFKNKISMENQIIFNNIKPIDEAYTRELAALFYNGYSAGSAHFYKEIAHTYFPLELEQKKQALRDLINYCHSHLYFEGFAIPDVLYALGYIQASLVKGFQEYVNLKTIKTVEPVLKTNPIIDVSVRRKSESKRLHSETLASNSLPYIPLKYPAAEIFDLWCVLLDDQLSQLMQVPHVFCNKKEIEELLGRLFKAEDQAEIWPMGKEFYYYELAPGYQNLLCLLMHATYKLNTTYLRIPQLKYCELLKVNFSPFENIESVGDIQRNMTKKKDSAIYFVHKSSGTHAKNAYNILKKVPTYIIKP